MPARRRPRSAVVLRATGGVGAVLTLTGCVVAPPADAIVGGAATTDAHATGPARTADGTFSGTGSYETPGGRQQIDVTVVLSDGLVDSLRVDPAATNTTSRHFQERFASVVVDRVVGRSLQDVSVGRLAGSSSTGTGFMAALDQVVRDATGA